MSSDAHITKSIIGYFAFDDNKKLLFYKLFKPSPSIIAEKLNKEIDDDFIANLSGYDTKEDDFAKKIMRKKIREFSKSFGFADSDKALNKIVSEVGFLLSMKKIKTAITKDKVVIQASNTLEKLNKMRHILLEHFKEWYKLHYPELKVGNKDFVELVAKYGKRENFPCFIQSRGIEFGKKDEEIVKSLANTLKEFSVLKSSIENYIKETMSDIAPNFSYLIDPLISAKLLSLAGSVEKLAKMPSSAIQLLGSERALFRHLRNRKMKAPKFGVLYECEYVKNAPKNKRGKIARIIASKLSVAAKIDFYSKRDERKKLKEEMENEIKNVLK